MPIKEIIQSIVEAETVDERMQIVEDNEEVLFADGGVNAEELQLTLDGVSVDLETALTEVEGLKEKYRTKFFSNGKADTDENPDEPDEPAEVKSLDETLAGFEKEEQEPKKEGK